MKRRKSSGSRSGALTEQSCSSWLLFLFSALPVLLMVAMMAGEVSGSVMHLMRDRNFTSRANRCPSKPLTSVQKVLIEHLRHNTSSHTAICEEPQLFDIVVGCGAHANATVESWVRSLCSASPSWGDVSQSRTRRRTSSQMGTKSNSVAARNSGAKSASRRRPRVNNDIFDKKMKRINSLMGKASCKPRKMLLPVTQAALLTDDERKYFTEKVHLEPCMIEVKRCGGCCVSELLECYPTLIKNKSIPFLMLESSGRETRSNHNDDGLVKDLIIQFHTKCHCECKTKSCNDYQQLNTETCTCQCPDSTTQSRSCPANQSYDAVECGCRCIHPNRPCNSGMRFDTSTCRCEKW